KSGGNSAASSGASAPNSGTSNSSGTPGSTGMPSGNTSSAPAGGTSGTPAPTSGTTDSSSPSATDNSTAVAADYAFQGGVIGDEKKLVIYAGRTPEAFCRYGNPGDQLRADQRQIIYWLGKSSNGGLYRRERPWITADGVRNAIDDDEEA